MKSIGVFVLINFLIVSACTSDAVKPMPPGNLPEIHLYSSDSPFNTPIPDNPEVDPASEKMVQLLKEQAEEQGFFLAFKAYNLNVYFVDSTTPRYDVILTATWAPARILKDVPIPDYAKAEPSTDGEMVIVDTLSGCEYDFWQARKISGRWFASWGNAIDISSNGVYEYGYSARGSGFAALAGVIWPFEIVQGEINHALVFSFDYTKFGGPVYPATESDGDTDWEYAIPEGARLQLNPDLDLSTLNLNQYELPIAKALQKYGMYLCDDGGGIEVEIVNPASTSGDPYQGIIPDEFYPSLMNIPVSEFRVLKLPPQNPNPEIKIVPTDCAKFR